MRPHSVDELANLAIDASAGRRLVVLIDGRSGAGKTTLAIDLGRALRRLGWPVQIVSLDDVYPGWHGLATAAAAVPQMLAPVDAGYRRYDWAQGRPADWVHLDPTAPIIIEGAGALTPTSAPRATLRVWVDGAEAVRRQAVVSRDGPVDDWWDDWSAQENAHIEADNPIALADVVTRSGVGF
ncbi:MAG: cobalt ABC transporter [Propionibacteriaceae bacterium]|nr:cobalt ABC transporter [Propionibacteriaceae bacterium]